MSNPKKFYAFIGQINTTHGTPHNTTGRLNTYGQIAAFSTKERRDHFVSEYYNQNNPSEGAYKTTYSGAKSEYFGGLTQRQYDEYMKYTGMEADNSYNSYFNVNS